MSRRPDLHVPGGFYKASCTAAFGFCGDTRKEICSALVASRGFESKLHPVTYFPAAQSEHPHMRAYVCGLETIKPR